MKDLVGAFAQFPHLPKMLRQKEILDTLVLGERNGLFVLRATRPDRSIRTFWRSEPEVADLRDPGLEVVLPEEAELTRVVPGLLAPNVLPGLWKEATISVQDIRSYFGGGVVTKVQHEGYEEQLTVPKASPAVVEEAIRRAVVEGTLWLTSGPASVWKEEIPTGILTSTATLQSPPSPIGPLEIVPTGSCSGVGEGIDDGPRDSGGARGQGGPHVALGHRSGMYRRRAASPLCRTNDRLRTVAVRVSRRRCRPSQASRGEARVTNPSA